jgi:hypothetical protein
MTNMRGVWPTASRGGITTAVAVVGSFLSGFGGTFTRNVCERTNAVASVNNDGESGSGSNDGWSYNTVLVVGPDSVTRDPMPH